jgi:hypothetical protein
VRDACIFLAPTRETDSRVSGADVAEERAEDEAGGHASGAPPVRLLRLALS